MKEYNLISNFNLNNNKYQLLLDNNKKYFFLKINNQNEFEYITLEEFITLARLFNHRSDVYLFLNKKKKKKKLKLIPKIIIGSIAVTLSLSLLSILDHKDYQPHSPNTYTTNISYSTEIKSTDPTQEAIDKVLEEIKKDKENFQVETMKEGFNLKLIYDSQELDKVLNNKKENITYNEIRELINNNTNIASKYKNIYLQLANNLEKEYPDMDLRIWYENLKTLKIVECEEMDMKLKAHSATANACYRKDENTIYTLKDYNYQEGTWEYQVIVHEMTHPIRSSYLTKNGEEIRTQFENSSGNGTIVGEALNSLLALRSYDKNEKNIAYQAQSNMIEVMLESMDNYNLQDYVEHNITYLQNELNIQNGNDKAVDILALMELQYDDYHNDEISVNQENYYELYDYISKMYYDKFINPNMSYSQALEIEQNLVEKITYDVPVEYNIDTNHFLEYFDNYCNEKGITLEKTK